VVARQPLIVIVGETAAGKSAMAMRLADQFNGEIICADSWTVYKGFDIGTAKPSLAEQKQIPHHLLDVADPKIGFSAAIFKRLATVVIDDIHERGKLPILVGGTGLYIDSVLYNYSFMPTGPIERRQELDKLSLDEVKAMAAALSLDTTGIDTGNKRRLIRLIENNGKKPERQKLRSNTLVLGLGVPKEDLEARIEIRVDSMISGGLENEVKQLKAEYGWDIEPMKGIGYREFGVYFAGEQTMEQTREQIIRSTLLLAKKQRTWFKRNKSIQWVNDLSQAVDLATTFLNKKQ